MANVNFGLSSAKSNLVVHLMELERGVVQITMKDEECRNTFSPKLVEGLYNCFSLVAQNNSYKVVILTGYGNYFCSGGTKETLLRIQKGEIKFNDLDVFRIPLDCQIPVISAMQGHGIGGGFVFGLYADLVVLSQESIYTTNFMKYGFTPGEGGTLIVPTKLGSVLGQEMMYTAQNYRGEELAKRGIPFPVLPRQEVLNYAKNLAYVIAEKPRLSLVTLKEHLTAETKKKLPGLIDKEVAMHKITFHQPEVATIIEESYGEVSSQKTLMNGEKKILSQLQSGEISLDQAESLLLGVNQSEPPPQPSVKKTDDDGAASIIQDDSENILSLLSSGEISLENAEKLLLEKAELDLTIEINEPTSVQNTDIAVIGISCRYPGAKNSKEFWEILKNGVDSIIEVPSGRWEEKIWYHPNPEHPGTSYSKCAGFLDEVDKFDPLFFQIFPVEAQFIDPQHRIFLEEAYHAIEDAGYAADSLKGKQCGVFVGAAIGDYIKLLTKSGLDTHRQVMTGIAPSILPARIAYFLDLKGPVVALDTACSSSLVAVHQACESIERGESELAIAGGISIMLTADFQIMSSQFNMVSPHGRCKTFDTSASGTVWSEGCGVVLLKRCDQAILDKDHIYGVIKGTGVNYDGNTNGISAPNSQSQTHLQETIYKKFGINPETISYVEAHGTATPLGDPIEVEALTETFSKWTNKKQFCAIGSVKTNIGHSSYSAGVSGLIKAILCLKNQKLVPSLHFNQSNPHIDFENSPFYVNTEFKDWEVIQGKPRRAAVSSFGFSGTNAHVVIEEAPTQAKVQKDKTEDNLERSLHLLTLSAKTEKALLELAERYHNYLLEQSSENTKGENLTQNNNNGLADICYTANTGRTHFNYRLAIIASKRQELAIKLLQYKQGEAAAGIFSGELPNSTTETKIAFLFTGQGVQYVNMGRQLYQEAPVFREAIDQCDLILRKELEHPLVGAWLQNPDGVLYPQTKDDSSSSLLNQTAYTQPALFALEYALAKLWQSWGIKPDVVMGHSVGEYVAATVAGVWSLEDGLKLIAARGRLMQQLPTGGEMVSVMADELKVRETLKAMSFSEKVAIAAINGPESVVISGNSAAVSAIISTLESEGIKTKQLQVSHAFHSPLMEPMLAEFEAIANQLTYNQPWIPVISNVTGSIADNSIATGKYWVDHVRQPVKFAQGINTLHQLDYRIFLEIGPKPVLIGIGRESLLETKSKKFWLPSLRPGKQDWLQVIESLARLYVQGVNVDWLAFDKGYFRKKLVLPTYPWQQRQYWLTDIQNHRQNVEPPLPQIQNQIQINRKKVSDRVKIRLSNLDSVSVIKASLLKERPKRQLVELTVKSTEPKLNIKSQNLKTVDTLSITSLKSQANSSSFLPSVINNNIDFHQIKETLKQKLAESLYINPSEIIENQKFIDLGLDSIVGVEWITTVNQHYGLNIKATIVYDYPTLLELTQYIIQLLSNQEKSLAGLTKPQPKTETSESISAQVNLSEIKQVLKQKLAEALYMNASEIAEDQKFIDLGLDSIVGVEWITNINQIYKLNIKATKLYDYPTLLELTKYIAQEISHTSLVLVTEQSKVLVQEKRLPPNDQDKPIKSQENFREELRLILDKVARKELPIQVANQMIQKLRSDS